MKFNVSKFKVLHVGHNNVGFKYQMEVLDLEQSHQEKDFGVAIHPQHVSGYTHHCLQPVCEGKPFKIQTIYFVI